jgi:plastocyanin
VNRTGDHDVVAGMNQLLRLAAAAAAVAIAVAACSSGADSSSSAAPGAAATTGAAALTTSAPAGGEASSSASTAPASIAIQNFAFGDPITVAPGTMVKVTNMDGSGHDVVSDDNGKFAIPVLNQGESGTFTAPTEPGSYRFSCTVHANMKGIGDLIVQG